MSEFFSPYQFIPVDTSKAKQLTNYRSLEDLKTPTSQTPNFYVRHDYWHQGGVSGRIRGTLTTVSPVVVGGQHKPTNPQIASSRIHPYKDRQGRVAIPANSLRGMISSIAETLSQSSMRVFSEPPTATLSVRKQAKSALKDIGVLRQNAHQQWFIHHLHTTSRDDADIGRTPKSKTRQPITTWQEQHNSALQSTTHYQGIFYIRGYDTDATPNKHSELYIPTNQPDATGLGVSAEVMKNFQDILQATYDPEAKFSLLPYGYEHTPKRFKQGQPQVLSGDLVYYREERGQVVELSYSAIWRKAVKGNFHQAFERSGGKNSLPWHPQRDHLTPAEALFGVVETGLEGQQTARNLASRVRFTDATLPTEQACVLENHWVVLKPLNSPKPLSAAMYFQGKQGYIAREQLDLTHNTPNGRKHYLRNPVSCAPEPAAIWETTIAHDNTDYSPDVRVECCPIPQHQTFEFEVWFENLSEDELGLLLTALEPASTSANFTHRLGLGKPLGLGHVRLKTEVYVVNRVTRYSVQGLKASMQRWAGIPSKALVDTDALNSLVLIGSYAGEKPVCYPFYSAPKPSQPPYNETEGFEWFVENDKNGKRSLKPVRDKLHALASQF